MDFSFGTLELARTDPAHIGDAPIRGTAKTQGVTQGSTTGAVQGEAKKGSFESYLMDAVASMNADQLKVSSLQEQVITDPDSVDIHDVTTAMAKAQMSLSLAQTVIDRVVKGWSDLSQNR